MSAVYWNMNLLRNSHMLPYANVPNNVFFYFVGFSHEFIRETPNIKKDYSKHKDYWNRKEKGDIIK